MSEWITSPLGALTVNHDGKRRPVKEADRRPGPYPYYGASGVVDYVDDYLIDGDYLLIAEDGENLRTRQTPIALVARGKSWVNNHAHIVTGNDRADTLFLKYAVQAADVGAYLTGAVMPKLTQGNLNRIPILHPRKIEEQREIAQILGRLDEKIDLNRRMNETLESMARAIFQSWFVDFDPVRAKVNGEDAESICQRLGLEPKLLSMFPAELEASELGPTPRGWAFAALAELSSHLSRGISPKYLEAGGVRVLNQKCIRNGKVSILSARRHDEFQRAITGRELAQGDILVNSTGTGTLGRVAQVLALEEPTVVDSHVTVVRANPRVCTPGYLSLALMRRQPEIEALGEGSTGQTELSRARLAAFKVLTPPVELMSMFDARIHAFRVASHRNDRQITALEHVRDALLPKLLAGALPLQQNSPLADAENQ